MEQYAVGSDAVSDPATAIMMNGNRRMAGRLPAHKHRRQSLGNIT